MLDDRAMAIFTARVYLAESHRRGRQPFAWVLLEWAANARRRAALSPRQAMLIFSTYSVGVKNEHARRLVV